MTLAFPNFVSLVFRSHLAFFMRATPTPTPLSVTASNL